MKTTFEVTIYEPEGEDPTVTSEDVRWAVLHKIAEKMGHPVQPDHFRLVAPSLAPYEGKFGVEVEFKERSHDRA